MRHLRLWHVRTGLREFQFGTEPDRPTVLYARMDGMPLFPAPGITAPIGEDALMLWLRRALAARHDATLAEALPAEWLRLIDPAGPPRTAT